MMHDGWMMNGWGMGPVMGILMLLFWGLVIFGMILAVRWLLSRGTSGEKALPETPLEILKKRYARGEISKEELDRMSKDLE